ncbi:MAG: branched-chain amino acid ABC transporter substrate-binding protein [Pseudomonadota bacterium]
MMKALVLSILAVLTTPSFATAEFRIGVAVPLTGLYAQLGQQILVGANFAARDINARGGLNGKRVLIDAFDDKCNDKTAEAVANQLVGRGVRFVIGHVCDRASIEGSTVYAQNDVIQISPSSQNPTFTDAKPREDGGTYRLAARNTQQADILADFVLDATPDRAIAVVSDGSVYGKGLADAVIANLARKNIAPTITEDFESGEERYRRLAARIVDAGTKTILIAAGHLDAATLIRDLDRLSDTITIVGGDGLVHSEFPNTVLEGNPRRNTMDRILVSFPPDVRRLRSARPLVQRFEEANLSPIGLALRGYAAVKIIEGTALGAPDMEFTSLVKAIDQMIFQTPVGLISFDQNGDANIVDYVVHRWENGTIVPLE